MHLLRLWHANLTSLCLTPFLFPPQDLILDLLQERLKELNSREGIVLVGFPRDIIQAQNFEEKVIGYSFPRAVRGEERKNFFFLSHTYYSAPF